MNRHVISALILLFALGLYAAGITKAAGIFLVLGFVFEMWFWVRVVAEPKQTGK